MKNCKKTLKSQKGFTLMEILVALSILMVVVFSFTPVMLHSLTQIKDSGAGEAAAYQQQGEIEMQLSNRDTAAIGAPSATIPIIFDKVTASGTVLTPSSNEIPISGKVLNGTGTMNLSTFFVDKDPTMQVSPATVCDDLNIGSQVLTIYGDGIVFENASGFKLFSMKGGGDGTQVTQGIQFRKLDDTTATIQLADNITMANGPYEIRYGNAKTQFQITPPAMLIVGNNGTYIVSNGVADASDKLTFLPKSGFPSQNLKAVAWNHVENRYEVAGDLYNGNNTNPDNPIYTHSANNTWNHNQPGARIGNLTYTVPGDDLTTQYRWKEPQSVYDDINISTVGINRDGEAIWGGVIKQNWQIERRTWFLGWGSWSTQAIQTNTVGFYENFGTNTFYNNSGITAVKKILTGFSGNDEVDVIFGALPSSTHYIFSDSTSNITIRVGSSNLGAAALNSAAYGLGSGGTPMFKVVANTAIYSSPTAGIKSVSGTTSTWTQDTGVPNSGSTRPNPIRDIAFGGDRWVAIGTGNYALYCTNGTAWSVSNAIPNATSTTQFNSIAYTNGYFVAVGNGGIISYSTNGVNWTTTTVGSQNLNGVAGQ